MPVTEELLLLLASAVFFLTLFGSVAGTLYAHTFMRWRYRRRVQQHVKGCSECQARVREGKPLEEHQR